MVTAVRAILHSSPNRSDLVRFYREGLGLGDPDHLQGEELFQVGDLHVAVNSGDGRASKKLTKKALKALKKAEKKKKKEKKKEKKKKKK